MKNRIFTFIFLSIVSVIDAQTNTFPATGNVGIGNLSPASKLVIANEGLNGLEIDPVTGWNGGTNIISYNRSLSLYTPLQLIGNRFSFGTSSVSHAMVMLNNGNIGIGHSEPGSKLVISNAGANGLEIDPVSGLSNGTNIISYNRSVEAYTPLQLIASNLIIGTSAVVNGISLMNNGNVGIGINSPISKLDVQSNGTGNNASSALFRDNSINGNALGITNSNNESRLYATYTGSSGSDQSLSFWTTLSNGNQYNRLHIHHNGNIGIGIVSPSEKVSVNGNVRAQKIIVSQSGWPDYVFDSSYSLRSLSEVEKFITKNKRLPEMPSAKEVEEKGISVGDNQALLLKKIEELTLYLIEQGKKINFLLAGNKKLNAHEK